MTLLMQLVYAREAYTRLLEAVLDEPVIVTRRSDLASAIAKRPSLVIVDQDLLDQVEDLVEGLTVIAISDGTLATTIDTLLSHRWVAHLVSESLLATPLARANFELTRERLTHGPEYHMVGGASVGRVALLTHSCRRDARLERLREFFASRDLPSRMIDATHDVAEELVTNALYDAPAEAGYFKRPVTRTASVELPPEHACEISYGIDGVSAFVRVRDPFGSLTRSRLISVLDRCNRNGVSLDESRGGAGLGLWRVFSCASRVAITVIPGRLTDVLVWVDRQKRRASAKNIDAVQLFFPPEVELDGALGRFAADHDFDLIDDSFTAVG